MKAFVHMMSIIALFIETKLGKQLKGGQGAGSMGKILAAQAEGPKHLREGRVWRWASKPWWSSEKDTWILGVAGWPV